MKDFIRDCMFFQEKDIELMAIGILTWTSIIGITILAFYSQIL